MMITSPFVDHGIAGAQYNHGKHMLLARAGYQFDQETGFQREVLQTTLARYKYENLYFKRKFC
jgi:hypothetical protein